MTLYDSIVIGGGPAGLTAALYLARSGCSVALIEKLTPGGQLLQTEMVENYPGYPKGIKGWELTDLFAAHIDDLSVDRFAEGVTSVVFGSGRHEVWLGEQRLECRSLVICSGAAYKNLGLTNEAKLRGHGVSYCAICDGNFFRGQNVAVVGGGNSALEETLYLAKIVNKVFLIHRRDAFRGAKTYQDRLATMPDKVEIIRSTIVTAIHGDNKLEGLTLRHVQSAEERFLPVEGFFVFVGFDPSGDFIPSALNKDEQGFIVTDTEMRTNVPGVFAAGDIRSKLCRQVSTAVGDGATAAQAAFVYLEQLDA